MSYEQTIYDTLRSCGLTQAAALGMLGNWYCESNCEPQRVQGDFSPYRSISKQYVSDITTGKISRDQFAHDQKGFGLAQWTYFSRKYALYDYWKTSGRTLDDPVLQTVFAMTELFDDFPGLLRFLQTTSDIYTATSRICREFERPAVNNIDARFAAAQRIKAEINLTGAPAPVSEPDTTPDPEPAPERRSYSITLREIRLGDKGTTVERLQALLIMRGYDCGGTKLEGREVPDGDFGGATLAAVRDVQLAAGIEVDGVVSSKTMTALLTT